MTFSHEFQDSVHLMKMGDRNENGCGTMVIIRKDALMPSFID